ncbi:hypothetical protein Pmani_018347 [Petrolisthes manimaculis]|uniref:Uncharacterized protein n=1 Tax=Petrolisthes manimaculis TaxID=1843537 RepID=A0AAE1PLN9_9EUCA|nr:hypothetical protein Pmani_018347 [Petrolisthes manimaculis]
MTWWWNEEVENSIKEKQKLWSDWKRGLVNKDMYLVAKRTARRAIYKAKTEAEKARENLEVTEAVAGPAIRIEKEMVRKAVSKMKKGKAAGPSGVVTEMLKASGETGIEMIKNLTNQITWRKALESKDLRVNVTKTKVMISGCTVGKPPEKGKFPCSVCGKGVRSNSIFCGTCKHWVPTQEL